MKNTGMDVHKKIGIQPFRNLRTFDWISVLGVTVCAVIYSCLFSESWKDFDWLGTLAAVTGIMSVVFSTHGNTLAYAFGLANIIPYAIISYKSNLLGDCLLYAAYYFPMQIIGWISWSRHPLKDDPSTVEPKRMGKKEWIITGLTSILSVAALGLVLSWLKSMTTAHPFIGHWHLYSEFPFRDAATTMLSIVGQYLMVRAYTEQWYFWLAVDGISLSMWAMLAAGGTPHAVMMVIMYVFYLANCANGMRLWSRHHL